MQYKIIEMNGEAFTWDLELYGWKRGKTTLCFHNLKKQQIDNSITQVRDDKDNIISNNEKNNEINFTIHYVLDNSRYK